MKRGLTMGFGICVGTDAKKIEILSRTGFDYFETNTTDITTAGDADFSEFAACIEKFGLPCEAANCFVPGEIRLCAVQPDYKTISEYVQKAFLRASQCGVKTIVFGSGKARSVPEGMKTGEAFDRLAFFLREIVAPQAERYAIDLAIEPLNKNECNIINSVPDGIELADAVGQKRVKTLADLYHMYLEDDSMEALAATKGKIIHAHIANPVERRFPKPGDGFDFAPFLGALKSAGCPRCSVEAGCDDFAADAPAALEAILGANA